METAVKAKNNRCVLELEVGKDKNKGPRGRNSGFIKQLD